MSLTRSILDSVFSRLARGHARRQYRKFIRETAAAVQVQEQVLRAKLRLNADSDFGRSHQFARIQSYDDFTAAVPVQSYGDIQPYVDRVMGGDQRALLGPTQKVLMFAMTSGSTDHPKYVPVTSGFLREYRRGWSVFGIKALLDHPSGFGRPILQIVSSMDDHRSPSGLPCGAISGLLANSQRGIVRRFYLIPPFVGEIVDPDARYYTIMRLAVPQNVGWVVTASPATPLKLARIAHRCAERLIRDVHDGTLTPVGELPSPIRRRLAARLGRDPQAARRLQQLLDLHGELLPKHYWGLAFMANWTGGTLGLYLRDFPHYFGDTPVRDIGLLATEGRVSIPLEDATPAGVLDVGGSFFEFCEQDVDPNGPNVVSRCHELDIGGVYRVIMTTSAGFYRYDLGDYVKVRGYTGQAPVLEFLHRGAHVSSITGEKLTEWQAVKAMEGTLARSHVSYADFILSPVWGDPPYYRLHVETKIEVSAGWAKALDDELSQLNMEYASKRTSGRLGPIELNVVEQGLLARVDASRRNTQSDANEQFKRQYLFTHPGDDDTLLEPRTEG